jgi:integrase
MAYIEDRPGGFLVVWRDAETRAKTSRLVKWNTDGKADPDDDFAITKEQARADAEQLRDLKRASERRYRQPLERVKRQVAQDHPEWAAQDLIPAGGEDLRFENYLRSIIERDELTESSRATYMHSLRNHIEGTPLGRRNIAMLDAQDVEDFWHTLDGLGIAARRNVGALLRKAFTRAVRRGLIDVNPMLRADIAVPSKRRRVRGAIIPLEPLELRQLADAADNERDRLIIKVMGYGGLRAGEVGGLTKRDIVRRGGYCELRLHQQVVRIGRVKKVTPMKTDAAQRHVPIPCQLADQLEAFIKATPPAKDGRVFHEKLSRMNLDGFLASQGINNAVQRAAGRAGLGPVNSHLLRHTAASMWFDDGADAESVRAALGHSDIKITLGLYAHMLKGGRAKLADSMARRMVDSGAV